MSDKNNKNPIQIYYLCNDTDSDTDSNCKKLIEMINVIVLNKLLNNPSYINKNNNIAESVINDKINELTNKLIVKPMTKNEYEEYTNTKVEKIIKSEDDFINNMIMNNMGMNDMGESYEMVSGMNMIEHMPNNMHHVPHIPKGGNILTKKSYKKHKKSHRHQKTKTHKKSKRIRKI